MRSEEHFLKQKAGWSGRGWPWRARESFMLAVILILLIGGVANAATLTVTSAADDGAGSLRKAISDAAPGDTINFDESLAGQTIVLTQGQLTIDKDLTIDGLGAFYLTIGPSTSRVFEITNGKVVSISGVKITGGRTFSDGGGIRNSGTLALTNCIVSGNVALATPVGGGGIFNGGTMTITDCTVSNNHTAEEGGAGGGIFNSGTLTVENSTISENLNITGVGGGIANGAPGTAGGTVTLINSTVSGNRNIGFCGPSASFCVGGGIFSNGTLTVINSTVSENTTELLGGGIESRGGNVQLQNTILAGNSSEGTGGGDDCSGLITSLGHNIIGTTEGCGITLQSTDQVGDPLLGNFLDPGSPGNGRFPLQSDSPAIDAGDNTVCAALSTDQLGQPRSKPDGVGVLPPCDIGAVQFFPPVNDLVQERENERVVQFDPTPAPGAPAGTFLIIAKFDKIRGSIIFFPFFEVAKLELQSTSGLPSDAKCSIAPAEDQPVLLNADGGPSRPQCSGDALTLDNVGARITPEGSLTTPFLPGATGTFQFRIGLQKREPFVFFVNMLGEPRCFPQLTC